MIRQAATQPRYLNVKDAAKYCGLSESTLKRRIKEKCFTTYMRGRRLIDRESLDAWIQDGEPMAGHRIEACSIEQIAADVREIRGLLERMGSAR